MGGLSVVRISGKDAINIAEKIFKPFGSKTVAEMSGHTCAYGKVSDGQGGEPIDEAVLTVFREPKSFTGENTAEISCHGGIFVTRQVLRACLENGAELAQAGEFTKRAFLNGKLSLTQAESVMDLISAGGEQALRSANLTREGRLFTQIKNVCNGLVKVLGELAAWNDYPEEDLPEVETSALTASLENAVSELDTIIKNYDSGRIFRSGVDTAIVGKPNVGKSTLMNMLLGYKRSIVTDIAGTTRDIVEESAVVGGLTLRLSDTAGIRETGDTVESMGVELAKNKLESCDLIMAVFDSSQPLTEEDNSLLESLKPQKTIIILNKSDLEQKLSQKDFPAFGFVIEISAKNEIGLGQIEAAISKIFELNRFDGSSVIFANERQKNCAVSARKYLSSALEALGFGETLDAVTIMIDKGTDFLLELTGEKATEAVVDEVFSKFCVGK